MIITQQNLIFCLKSKNREEINVYLTPDAQQTVKNGIIVSSTALRSSNYGKECIIIDHAGEYEIKNVFIEGRQIPGQNETIYRLRMEDITIIYLGAIRNTVPDNILEKNSGGDIILANLNDNLEATVTAINKLDAKIIIPNSQNQENLAKFAKLIGLTTPKPQSQLKITAKDIADKMQLIILI